jgi:hypothetical protein
MDLLDELMTPKSSNAIGAVDVDFDFHRRPYPISTAKNAAG